MWKRLREGKELTTRIAAGGTVEIVVGAEKIDQRAQGRAIVVWEKSSAGEEGGEES